jgi:hypothetical protein
MIIANPIYDTVFKYLMEDMEIAKGLLSTILQVEVIELSLQPQETSGKTEKDNQPPIRIYRLDFAAVIKDANGEQKKVLIELQKTRRSTNILRFRRYLAENYHKEDTVVVNGRETKQSLEIVTIYFLGFSLDDVPTPVMKVSNRFEDVTTGKELKKTPKDKFVRLLNHESYMIQIPKLIGEHKSQIENVLGIFNQTYKMTDEHFLNYKGDEDSSLLKKMLKRLHRAVADEQMKKQMDIEDEFEREYGEIANKYNVVIEEQGIMLREKDKELAENAKALEERDKLIEELKRQLMNNKK